MLYETMGGTKLPEPDPLMSVMTFPVYIDPGSWIGRCKVIGSSKKK